MGKASRISVISLVFTDIRCLREYPPPFYKRGSQYHLVVTRAPLEKKTKAIVIYSLHYVKHILQIFLSLFSRRTYLTMNSRKRDDTS